MAKKFEVIGNTVHNHNFQIGQIVELVQVYEDGIYEVRGKYFHVEVNQDIHPRDLTEVIEGKF